MDYSQARSQSVDDSVPENSGRMTSDLGDKGEGDNSQAQSSRRPQLPSLQIPARTLDAQLSSTWKTQVLPSPGSTRAGLPPRPASTRAKSSSRVLFSQRSLRTKNSTTEGDRTVLLVPGTPSSEGSTEKATTSRQFSITKVLSAVSAKRTHSLPVTPVGTTAPATQDAHVIDLSNLDKKEAQVPILRSLSVPGVVKTRSLRRMDSFVRVIPATPRPPAVEDANQSDSIEVVSVSEEEGEDIPEEEAVCRICFVELAEGGEMLKLECSCKGELALAHQECAVKWFSIKGNKQCDVCKQEVKNLPVTLLRLHNPQTGNRRQHHATQQQEVTRYRVWQDVPVLVMVSMLAYFCFLEQLLVTEMGSRALALSLPFSCVLGLLSSMISSTMVSRSYIWAYASFQFAIVILFAHIFYNVLGVAPVLSVLLSSFTGFGIAISTNSLLVEYLRWRTRRNLQLAQQQNRGTEQRASVNQSQDTNTSTNRQNEVENTIQNTNSSEVR